MKQPLAAIVPHVHHGPKDMRTLFALAALVAVCAACTPHGYTKPEMTDQGLTTDQAECAAIARENAFLDNSRDRLRAEAAYSGRRRDAALYPYGTFPSFGELQNRYYRICMQARGYRLVPLEEGEEQNQPEEEN